MLDNHACVRVGFLFRSRIVARIRTIKPEFFRDEILSELETNHPEARPMLVFAGLWGHCDKQGVFPWNPRQLALDILPFIWEGNTGETPGKQMGNTLELLSDALRVVRFEENGKSYGFVPTFEGHQRITGKEHTEPARYPSPPEGNTGETTGKQQGSQEGKGREGKRNGEGADRKRSFPRGWVPKDKHQLRARDFGLDVTTEAEKFENKAIADGVKHIDWDRAFTNWLIKGKEFLDRDHPKPAVKQGVERYVSW